MERYFSGRLLSMLQAKSLGIAEPGKRVRARLRMLERLGFLRRVSKYPVVYQITRTTPRLVGQDSSARGWHTLETVQARLLAVHFYLEARTWPAEFVFDHEQKITIFRDAGCPLGTLPQRGGQAYLWLPDGHMGIAMVDPPQPTELVRLRLFLQIFLPVLRYLREEIDLLLSTMCQSRHSAILGKILCVFSAQNEAKPALLVPNSPKTEVERKEKIA